MIDIPILLAEIRSMRGSDRIRETTRGNVKIGDSVPTESRPTIYSCPDSCPLKKGGCYSAAIERYHPGVHTGIAARHDAWRADRAAWRARRSVEWAKAASDGIPVRLLVHGDLLRIGSADIDRRWIADVIIVARASARRSGRPFRAWGYTHAWKELGARHRRAMAKAGIVMWASVHNVKEARQARAMGFKIAFISREKKRGYIGARAKSIDGHMHVVCPQQMGARETCAECGLCFRANVHADIVLLKH